MATIKMNPGHELANEYDDMWPNIAALIMKKLGVQRLLITPEDVEELLNEDTCLAIGENAEGLHISVITMAEAAKLAEDQRGQMH